MYDEATRAEARALLRQGHSLSDVSRALGVQRSTLRAWKGHAAAPHGACPRCNPGTTFDEPAYAHLLGLYLGDGCLSALKKGVYSLRITCATDYPELINEADASVRAMRPDIRVCHVTKIGCLDVQASWKHWPCLFPQHGPGRKHERPIELAEWQRTIVETHPGPFLRGLFHSDGCRVTNWTVRVLKDGPKRYEYPRYLFSNESTDIIALCGEALDLLAIHWTLPRRNLLSVARGNDVRRLDLMVGAKR